MGFIFDRELGLPVRGISQRVTIRGQKVVPGQTLVLFDRKGPGCLLHWWLTYSMKNDVDKRDLSHDIQLRIFYDGSETPTVDMTLARFFGLLLDHDVYTLDSAAIKILPQNAFNCYFPRFHSAISNHISFFIRDKKDSVVSSNLHIAGKPLHLKFVINFFYSTLLNHYIGNFSRY